MRGLHQFRIRILMMWMLVSASASQVSGEDWPQFRGPGGAGVAPASSRVPTTWDSQTGSYTASAATANRAESLPDQSV